MAISHAAWSGDASRFTPEEWARSCLIHMGSPTDPNKNMHKLPVREPGGEINANALSAAAGALVGARGGVDAPPQKKRAAARELMGMYRQAGMMPPDSLRRMMMN